MRREGENEAIYTRPLFKFVFKVATRGRFSLALFFSDFPLARSRARALALSRSLSLVSVELSFFLWVADRVCLLSGSDVKRIVFVESDAAAEGGTKRRYTIAYRAAPRRAVPEQILQIWLASRSRG